MLGERNILFLIALVALASNIATTPIPVPGNRTIPAPAPTTSGATDVCGRWYVVQPNDTQACFKALASTNITLHDFRSMNPAVDSFCGNLWPNHAYCVIGSPPSSHEEKRSLRPPRA
ncbi:MAG: hypothetical protein M1840_004008 [Geoglossum simile]|nr:MAG: hypothetical protein M1840_004008 [Geoglossum simile]